MDQLKKEGITATTTTEESPEKARKLLNDTQLEGGTGAPLLTNTQTEDEEERKSQFRNTQTTGFEGDDDTP
jgi:hypothetical protein